MSKRQTTFTPPRGEDGTFLPRELWSKKDQRTFDRLKREGAFKNPVVKKKGKRRKTTQDVWIPPQDPETGQFLPMDEWSASEKRAYNRALEEGIVPGTKVRRSKDSGQFVSKSGKKRRRKKTSKTERRETRRRTERLDDDIRKDIRRLEALVAEALVERDDDEEETVREVIVVPQRRKRKKVERVFVVPDQAEEEYADRQLSFDIDEVGSAPEACDPCQAKIFEETQRVGRLCEASLQDVRPLVRNRELAERRLHRAMMYNRPQSIAQRFVEIIDFFKERPLIALLGAGAMVLLGYAIYRIVKTAQSSFFAGAQIINGVMHFPGEAPYQITQDDMLWLARSIWGEVSRTPSEWDQSDVQQGASAVLWAYANHYMTVGQKRQLYPTLGSFVQAYSQPINPRWIDPNSGRCPSSPEMCTPDRIAFRRALRAKPWTDFPIALTNLVQRFVAGQVSNPIGTRTDFRAAGTGLEGSADAVNVAGNIFITADNARRRTAVA